MVMRVTMTFRRPTSTDPGSTQAGSNATVGSFRPDGTQIAPAEGDPIPTGAVWGANSMLVVPEQPGEPIPEGAVWGPGGTVVTPGKQGELVPPGAVWGPRGTVVVPPTGGGSPHGTFGPDGTIIPRGRPGDPVPV